MGFYSLPRTKTALNKELNTWKGLGLLTKYHRSQNAPVNALTTLPAFLPQRSSFFKSVQEESEKLGVSLKLEQFLKYGKLLIKFYKTGVINVWNNQKALRQLRKLYMLTTEISKQGTLTKIAIPNFNKLTNEMSTQLYMLEVENSKKNDSNTLLTLALMESAFNIDRLQFQLYRRTPSDFIKLPLFAVIAAVFFETTPIVCYIVPEITPLTCVLPSLLPKLWSPSSTVELVKARKNKISESLTSSSTFLEDKALQTAYNLPKEEVQLLAKSLRLTSRWIPSIFYPDSILRKRLQQYYCYLVVDDHFITTNGGVWSLAPPELVVACLERNLILDIKKDYLLLDQPQYLEKLRMELTVWLLNFKNSNLGYIGLNHLIGPALKNSDLQPIDVIEITSNQR